MLWALLPKMAYHDDATYGRVEASQRKVKRYGTNKHACLKACMIVCFIDEARTAIKKKP
jgi:hypothetical protein